MAFSDLVKIIKSSIVEAGIDYEEADFDDIMNFIKKADKLFKYIDKLASDGLKISRNDIDSIMDPFIGAVLDEYATSRGIDTPIEENTIGIDIDNNDLITSTTQMNQILSQSKIFTPENEKEVFWSIREDTLRIVKLDKTVESLISKARAEYNHLENKTYVDLERFEQLVEDIRTKSPEAIELRNLREKVKPQYDLIYRSNIKWVKTIAGRFAGRCKSFTFADLLQVGTLGLLRAIEKFDVSKNYKFSTYATWWIRQGIAREIGNYDKMVRLPIHYGERVRKINNLRAAYYKEGITLTEAEIAKKLNLTVAEVLEVDRLTMEPTSLNVPVGEEEDTTLGELLPDENASIESQYEIQILKDTMHKLMSERLSEREKDILEWRFGMKDGIPHTLEYVGEKYQVTRERIRQIEAKGIKKLRQPRSIDILKDFI